MPITASHLGRKDPPVRAPTGCDLDDAVNIDAVKLIGAGPAPPLCLHCSNALELRHQWSEQELPYRCPRKRHTAHTMQLSPATVISIQSSRLQSDIGAITIKCLIEPGRSDIRLSGKSIKCRAGLVFRYREHECIRLEFARKVIRRLIICRHIGSDHILRRQD